MKRMRHDTTPLTTPGERDRSLQTAFDRATVGIALVSLEGRWLHFNQRLCDLLGYSREELAAHTWQDLTFPDDRAASDALFRRTLSGERDVYDLNKRYVRKDGTQVWAHLTVALVRTPEGEPDYFLSMTEDITIQKRLEQDRAQLLERERAACLEAEATNARLDRIFEAVADGLMVWDAEGQLMCENAAARSILGLDSAPPDFYQPPVRDHLAWFAARDEQDRPVPLEEWPVQRALRGEVVTGPESRELRLRALDGREIELNMSSAPLRDREGHLVGAVCVTHDMTERNRLKREREAARADELAAREASRRMETFLAVAAHDLRSPLTATVGYLALAQRQSERLASAARETSPDLVSGVEAVRNRVEDAGQSAKRLTRLLTRLFDVTAIRADRLELRRAPLDLALLVREQVAALCVAAPDRTITLQTPVNGAPIMVEADADRIGQVVTNYVTNALKYSPPDQPVDVSVEVRRGRAHVAVRDAGPGIPKEERTRVWELFHRAPGVATAGEMPGGMQGGSLGLGLYICKAIISAHGGRVGVASAVGKGSTFWFTLPLSGSLPGRASAAPCNTL